MKTEISEQVAASVGEVMATGHGCLTEVQHTEEAMLALTMLAAGESYRSTMRKTGLSLSAVQGLKARHAGTLENVRRQMAAEGRELADGYMELQRRRIEQLLEDEDELKKVDLRQLTYGMEGALRAHMQLSGDDPADAVKKSTVSLKDAIEEIEAAKKRGRDEAVKELKEGSVDV